MAKREQLEGAIKRLRQMNSDLQEQIAFFGEPGTWFQVNGKDETTAMIAQWQLHIERNEKMIEQFEEEIAQGT